MHAIHAADHLELRHLRYFVAVAEHGGFRRAASRLHISQPPLSHAIAQLEARVGAILLTRSHSGVRLTAAGETFCATCGCSSVTSTGRSKRRAALVWAEPGSSGSGSSGPWPTR